MIRAYSKVYVNLAQQNLASMIDCAVTNLHYDIDKFFSLFVTSGIAKAFGNGDYRYISGMSGPELMNAVLEKIGLEGLTEPPRFSLERTPEFWTGWVLAYYQWWSALTFEEIDRVIKPSEIRILYNPFHEMSLDHIVEELDRRCRKETRLKNLRLFIGLSQSQLAEISGVPVRTIQQYEQRTRDINKAQATTVAALASALCTESRNLLENT